MKVVLILAALAAVLVLLSLLRVGVRVLSTPSGLTLRVKAGPASVTLLPRRARKKKKRPKAAKASPPARSRGDMLTMLRQALPLVAEGAGRLKRKVRLDRIYLDVTAAAPDPASAAVAFGGINAAIGMIWPLVEQNFNVKDRRIRTRVDFEAGQPTASLDAAATLTVGQAVALALWLAPRLPQVLGREKKNRQTDTIQKEAV